MVCRPDERVLFSAVAFFVIHIQINTLLTCVSFYSDAVSVQNKYKCAFFPILTLQRKMPKKFSPYGFMFIVRSMFTRVPISTESFFC